MSINWTTIYNVQLSSKEAVKLLTKAWFTSLYALLSCSREYFFQVKIIIQVKIFKPTAVGWFSISFVS